VLGLLSQRVCPAREGLRVATYNLQNYTSAGRMTGDGFHKDYPKPEAAKRALHTVFKAMDADIVVVQEMGSEAHLRELQMDLRALGLDYPHCLLAEANDSDRHLAVLSRVPFVRSSTFSHLDFNYLGQRLRVKRGLLELVIATDAGPLTLWGVHLKSRFTEHAEDPESNLLRGAEATAIRDLILRRHPDPSTALFCILGDFNDGKQKRPLRAMQERGTLKVAELLNAQDSRSECWTHYFQSAESYEHFDHILVSPPLVRRVLGPEGQQGSKARILDVPETLEASDHRPVLVELGLHPINEPNPSG
jgi:endonuclease/exonuclease/phosphatase family metal-dependent hydrolase